jgi:hypothetical protein
LFFEKEEDLASNGFSPALPKMVRSLPKTVRLPRQRSTGTENQSSEENALKLTPTKIDFWEKFHDYLLRNNKEHTAKVRLSYCRKHYYVLQEGNAQELLLLSEDKRLHVMKSLAALSKFLGCYDRWNEIREMYQLKWSGDDSLQIFKNMTNPKQDYQSMNNWLKDVLSKLPEKYGNILLFDSLTGLRPAEASISIHLIQNRLEEYLNKESFILEHFKYPEKFIRRTKKAYISIVNEPILQLAKESADIGYNALRLAVRERDHNMNMSYCRKIFATYLRMDGVEQETIDLLQGRVPNSVFTRHYFRPDIFNHSKVFASVMSFYDSLSFLFHASSV